MNTIEIDYKRVASVVRPHRYAVLFDINAKTWPSCAKRAIEVFSMTWGGEYFILIPTDGNTIMPEFWNIIEAYSPDEIGIYRETLADLKEFDSEAYASVISRWREQIGLDDDHFQQWVDENEAAQNISTFEISQTLKTELKERIRPNRADSLVIRHAVFAGREPDWPFSNVGDIFKNSKTIPDCIFKPKNLANASLDLLAASIAGAMTDKFEEKLTTQGLIVFNLPDNFTDQQYMNDLLSRDRSGMLTLGQPDNLDPAWKEKTPFSLSMLNLTRVYRLEPNKAGREGILVVIGNSISDFCLYYSLRRIQENVYWLPDDLLVKLLKKYHQNSLRRIEAGSDDYERIDLSPEEEMTQALIISLLSAVSYHMRDDRPAEITSVSLSRAQLNNRVSRAAQDPGITTDFFKEVSIVDPQKIDVSYVARVMELHNYTTQQTMTFKGNRSVELLETPKPKHFNIIDQNHRWISSFDVDGYRAPKLSTAGNAIVGDGRKGAYDARVATDGIAYLCPGIGWFANDIDANLDKPLVTLLTARNTFDLLFSEFGWRTEVSDKGRYSQEVVRMFGGLDNLAKYLKLKTVQQIMALFVLKKQNPEIRDKRTFVDFGTRSYLNYDQIKKSSEHNTDVSQLIDDLVGYGVLIRGLLLKCGICACLAWYHIDESGTSFKCKRCFQEQSVARANWSWHKAPELTWFYSLSEIFYQFYANNSHIPTLALHALKQRSKYFDFTPELALYKQGDKKAFIEIDMSCVLDGTLVLGEAKIHEIKEAELDPLIEFNKLLLPRPVHYVFVSGQSKTKADVKLKAKRNLRSLEFMTRKDIYN